MKPVQADQFPLTKIPGIGKPQKHQVEIGRQPSQDPAGPRQNATIHSSPNRQANPRKTRSVPGQKCPNSFKPTAEGYPRKTRLIPGESAAKPSSQKRQAKSRKTRLVPS